MNKSLLYTFAYTNNLMFFTGLIIVLTIFGYGSLAAEIGITYSIVASVNQIFSYNLKNLILFDNNKKFASEVFSFRLFLGALIFFISILSFYYYDLNFYSNELLLTLILIVIQLWLLEILLIVSEINKKIKIINYYNCLSFLNIFLVVINIFLYENKYLQEIFYIIFLENLFLILKFSKFIKIINLNFFKIFNSISKIFAFTSSLSIILSIFFWRLFIYINFEKDVAGILYSSFAIGSFAGSFFATAIGPSLIKNKINTQFYVKIYSYSILILMILIFYFIETEKIFFNLTNEKLFFLKSTIYSLAGSSFMLFAVNFRLNYFYNNINLRKIVYKYDIINSFFISLVPFVIFIYDKKNVMISYLVASLLTYVMYFYLYKLKLTND